MKFRIAAKTDMGLVRQNNEDNFQAASDLNEPLMRWVNNATCNLGTKGALIVVADGMGGMNAGEVASEIAINTVREWFKPERLTSDVMATRFTIEKYMNEAIVQADANIKAHAKAHPDSKGMGTTIVIGWLLKGVLYISWCGDSRAYVYNPATGLHQISKDHSYVQGLIDKGQITREEAFDFPGSNIITRSLCDGGPKAKPESLFKPYQVADGDVVMLCTDGLSGMIHDAEIEAIMAANLNDTTVMVDELIKGACEAEGSDNITICLCQILEGGGQPQPAYFEDTEKRLNGKDNSKGLFNSLKPGGSDNGNGSNNGNNGKLLIIIILAAVLAVCIGIILWLLFSEPDKKDDEQSASETEQVENGPAESEQEPEPGAGENAPDNQTQQPGEPKVAGDDTKQKQPNGKPSLLNKIANPNNDGNKDGSNPDDSDLTLINDGTDSGENPEELTNLNPGGEEVRDSDNALDGENTADNIVPISYTVKPGDTAYKIAKSLGLKGDLTLLQQLNPDIDLAQLKAGQVILIPTK